MIFEMSTHCQCLETQLFPTVFWCKAGVVAFNTVHAVRYPGDDNTIPRSRGAAIASSSPAAKLGISTSAVRDFGKDSATPGLRFTYP